MSPAPPALVTRAPDALTVAGCWTYRWGARRHPHVHPLVTPAGHVLSRDAPPDHPWHHGLWCTIKLVDGDNFWEEAPPYGVQRHETAPTVTERPDAPPDAPCVVVEGDLRWIRPDRETIALDEARRLTHVALGADAYALDVEITLVPRQACVLDRTPFTTWGGYGGLTLRGAGDWSDTRLLLDDGTVTDRVLGTPARWCDLTGTAPGPAGVRAGVAILCHPDGARSPMPFYGSTRAATYGDDGWSNFLNAAVLWDGPVALAAGEPLHLRHRVLVHDGEWSAARLDDAHAAWVAA